ncbi:uncharacterized [Tachysurus ichikawai]
MRCFYQFIPHFTDLPAPLNNLKQKDVRGVQMDASDVGLGAILIHQTSEDKKTSPQQARQTLKLQQFNFDIHYHKECMDIVLDALFWAVEPEQAPVLAS